jgi:hypothetical protein
LAWEEQEGEIVVRRAGRYSFEEIHRKLFGKRKPKARKLEELKEGLRRHVRERHARR